MIDLKLPDRTLRLGKKELVVTGSKQMRALEGIPMMGGFAFDVFTLSRIDQAWSLIQQGLFIAFIFVLLYLDTIPEDRRKRFSFLWKYNGYMLQFMFGGLLSAYTIFYFKSASSLLVVAFAVFLFLLMIVNESRRFHALNFPVKYFLASLCLTSFVIYLFPIIFKWMNWFTFLLSIAFSLFIYLWLIDRFHPRMSWWSGLKRQRALWGSLVPLIFAGLYFLKLIPPVPLSCKELGIYHDVKRDAEHYQLFYSRPSWKFWQHGDQDFEYREGDRVYVFTRVFAPSSLEHEVRIRLEKLNSKNRWETTDTIPMAIRGGREEGYRGVAYKQNVSTGKWRVRVETGEGRELRRLRFQVSSDPNPQDLRQYKVKKI